MTDVTFDLAHQDRARVALAVTTCRNQLAELAGAGLRLDDEQAAELSDLVASVSPPKATKAQPRKPAKD